MQDDTVSGSSWREDSLWPAPYDRTSHRLEAGDARELSHLRDASVHLALTSPPYFALKDYDGHPEQLGAAEDYEEFLAEIEKVLAEVSRTLVPGGRVACVVGDVLLARGDTEAGGRHRVLPLHADIQTMSRRVGLDNLTPVLWMKLSNGAREASGSPAGGRGGAFYGTPRQPGGIVKADYEYVLMLRKPGDYRHPEPVQRELSALSAGEQDRFYRPLWEDIPGADASGGHPAPFPLALARRLVRMLSFAGDTVLDPFAGSGTTALACMQEGRSSASVELEPRYLKLAESRLRAAAASRTLFGAAATEAEVMCPDGSLLESAESP